jgi:hypothetical protein
VSCFIVQVPVRQSADDDRRAEVGGVDVGAEDVGVTEVGEPSASDDDPALSDDPPPQPARARDSRTAVRTRQLRRGMEDMATRY